MTSDWKRPASQEWTRAVPSQRLPTHPGVLGCYGGITTSKGKAWQWSPGPAGNKALLTKAGPRMGDVAPRYPFSPHPDRNPHFS